MEFASVIFWSWRDVQPVGCALSVSCGLWLWHPLKTAWQSFDIFPTLEVPNMTTR